MATDVYPKFDIAGVAAGSFLPAMSGLGYNIFSIPDYHPTVWQTYCQTCKSSHEWKNGFCPICYKDYISYDPPFSFEPTKPFNPAVKIEAVAAPVQEPVPDFQPGDGSRWDDI